MGHGDVSGTARRGAATLPARAVASAPNAVQPKTVQPKMTQGAPPPPQHRQPPAPQHGRRELSQHLQAGMPPKPLWAAPPSKPQQPVQPAAPATLQPKLPAHGAQRGPGLPPAPPRSQAAPVLQSRAALQAKSAPGQTRIYPNLRPLAQQNAPNEEIFSLQQWYGNYGMRGTGGRGHYVPNARYLFVRTTDGQTLMHPRLRHPVLASGEPVMYAGEAYFESGALRWWSNGSGHYRPDSEHAPQAGLPLDKFRTWDDVVRRGTRAPPQTSA